MNFNNQGEKKEIYLEGKRKLSSESDLFFEATSIIDRQDFGVSWNKPFQKIAGMMVSNKVKIFLKIKMIKSQIFIFARYKQNQNQNIKLEKNY